MLILASVSDLLQVVTSAGGSINVHASYLDNVAGTVAPGRQNTSISTATTTTVVPSPAASTYRNLKTLHVHNHGAAANTITVQHTDGTTTVQLHRVTLGPLSTLQYIDEVGFLISPTPPQVLGGVLKYSSPTALSFAPLGGNYIRLNGVIRQIPNAGIAGLANIAVYVNGTAGQNLVPTTVYWVFVFDVAGVLTADFRTAATHVTSATAGNEGTEILTGDDTHSLIGICYTNASSQFDDSVTKRNVRSWFNDPGKDCAGFFTATYSTAATVYVEINPEIRIEFVNWASERVAIYFNGSATQSGADVFDTSIGIDGVTPEDVWVEGNTAGLALYQTINLNHIATPAEGHHFATVLGSTVNGVTASWDIRGNSIGRRGTLKAFLKW